MSFADELRMRSTVRPEEGCADTETEILCDRLTEAIKEGCLQATREGRRSLFGYVYMYTNDSGAARAQFVSSLPRLNDQQNPSGDTGRGRAGEETGQGCPGTQTREERLYEGYIIPGNVSDLQTMERLMSARLQELGFTDFRVQKVMLMDVYITRVRRSSRLSGSVPGRITSRTAHDPVYTLHFSVSW